MEEFYSKKSKTFTENADTYIIAMFREIMHVYNTVMRNNPFSLRLSWPQHQDLMTFSRSVTTFL